MTDRTIDSAPEGVEIEEDWTVLNGFSAREGWAVYSGCEGEVATFRGFFPDEVDARAFAESRYPFSCQDGAEENERVCHDPYVVPALIVDGTMFTANDYDIDTIEDLRERVRRHLVDGIDRRAAVQP